MSTIAIHVPNPQEGTAPDAPPGTIGGYLGKRLVQAGLEHWFAVPGDFNLVLMDQLLATPGLEMVCCCNELNAGYAADGYARARGFSAVVVTYTVGALSLVNAAAGAYSDQLPLLIVSGGPNSNDAAQGNLIHHSMGLRDFFQVRRVFGEVTEACFIVERVADAGATIDEAIEVCLRTQRPVYLEIACNLAATEIAAPTPRSLAANAVADGSAVASAASRAADLIRSAVKPVILVGSRIRAGAAAEAALRLAEALKCALAYSPDAKGRLPEDHPQVIGMYWGPVSSAGVQAIVESADLVIALGYVRTDYTSVGWTAGPAMRHTIDLDIDRARMPGGSFTGVPMADLANAIAALAPPKPSSLEAFRRLPASGERIVVDAEEATLSSIGMIADLQAVLTGEMAVVAETGDSWFSGQKLRLPRGAQYEWQMMYGSIGWAVPAAMGYAQGSEKRVLLLVGDGSFQLTAQEVSTMIRRELDVIIILINNGGYTIEVEIHDGPYNVIKNWDYAGLMAVLNSSDGHGLGLRAATGGQFRAALQQAVAHRQGPTLIEVVIARDDCSQQLLEWGVKVAAANDRPPAA